MDVLISLIVVIISQAYVQEIFLLYTLNIYNFTFQLYLNKAEKKSDWTQLNWSKHNFFFP